MAITRIKNSSIRNGTPKYNDFQAGLPFRPAIGTATAGVEQASVAFTGNNVANGTITYTALSSPGNITATGTASPIVVTGLTAGTGYTFQVKAGNSLGDSAYSAASNSVTPTVATAYDSIASIAGSGSTVTISNIPQTYKHLQIRAIVKNTDSSQYQRLQMYFNSLQDNYANHNLYGNGSTVVSNAATGNSAIATWNTTQPSSGNGAVLFSSTTYANTFGVVVIDIHDYASTTKRKVVRSIQAAATNDAEGRLYIHSGAWQSTSAITSISFLVGNGTNWATGTSFALYGIKG